jgi:hypothetical protein
MPSINWKSVLTTIVIFVLIREFISPALPDSIKRFAP